MSAAAWLFGGPLDGVLLARSGRGAWPLFLSEEGQKIPASQGDRCLYWGKCRGGAVYFRQTAYWGGHYSRTYYLHSTLQRDPEARQRAERQLVSEMEDSAWLLQTNQGA